MLNSEHGAQLDLFSDHSPEWFGDVACCVSIVNSWHQLGWVRTVDWAVADWLSQRQHPQSKGMEPAVLMLLVLCSHQLGRGQVCVSLNRLVDEPDLLLAMPPEGEWSESQRLKPSVLFQGLGVDDWQSVLQRSTWVGLPLTSNTLMVLQGQRVYLRRMWDCEQRVLNRLRSELSTPLDLSAIPQKQAALQKLFGQNESASATQPNWQHVACALSILRTFSVITGGPGTGKTTTVLRLLASLVMTHPPSSTPLRIALAAPTGKAAARLTESISSARDQLSMVVPPPVLAHIPTQVTTLHRLLGIHPTSGMSRYSADHPLPLDCMVVDEASMVDLELFDQLLQALKPGTRLVLLGDKDQLASVEAGSVLGDLCRQADHSAYSEHTLEALSELGLSQVAAWQSEHNSTSPVALGQCVTLLRVSHRFAGHSGIGQLAKAVHQGNGELALTLFSTMPGELTHHRITAEQTCSTATWQSILEPVLTSSPSTGWQPWLDLVRSAPKLRFGEVQHDAAFDAWGRAVLQAFAHLQWLSPLRRGPWGVEGLNDWMMGWLRKSMGVVGRPSPWVEGRPLMVTHNEPSLGLMNGDVGILLDVGIADAPDLRAVFKRADGSLRWLKPTALPEVDTAFCLTVHKSQGSEFNHAVLVMPPQNSPVLTRELFYTAVTRAKSKFTLVSADPTVVMRCIARSAERAGGLNEGLQRLT